MMIKERTESPFVDGDAVLRRKKNKRTFRKEEFEITEHYYECLKTGQEFTNDEIDQININQVYNQYRDRFGLPFPDQIKRIREKYEVSASKMSEILGLGANSYRLYEQGDVPSVGNGRLTLAADDPGEFKRFLKSSQEVIGDKDYEKLSKRVDKMIDEREKNRFSLILIGKLFNDLMVPDEFTGYRLPNIDKISQIILFFSGRIDTWKTKLNKLLFYSDFLAFKQSGYGISGLNYRAIQMGPVPVNFEDMYNQIANDGRIVKREYKYLSNGNYGSIFIPNRDFDSTLFTDFELNILDIVTSKLADLTPGEVINKSHEEVAWKDNTEGKKIISYKDYGFELKEL